MSIRAPVQCVITGAALLASDSAHSFYKLRIPHGVRMVEGSVRAVCSQMGMAPVCYWHTGSRVEGCVVSQNGNTNHGGGTLNDLAVRLCGSPNYFKCQQLHGVFIEMRNDGGRNKGVSSETDVFLPGDHHTSGPGSVYRSSTATAQYYGLCAAPK